MAAISCALLVDDDDTTNFLNQALLKRMDVADTVLVAGNGQEALNLLATHCAPAASAAYPALILLDVKMPLMDGFEFLRAYRQRPPVPNPAVVIMLTTSLTINETAFQLGFEYPQYFTRLFKSKTGLTPAAFRFSAQ